MPASVQFLAVQPKRETALAVALLRVTLRIPAATVPDHHRAAAVLAFRDRALEGVVFDRVVLDVNRESLLARHEARAAGDGPAFHDAIELEPQVVMQAARSVLLDHVSVPSGGGHAPARFRRYVESALGAVGLERHAARLRANSWPMANSLFITDRRKNAGCATQFPYVCRRLAPQNQRIAAGLTRGRRLCHAFGSIFAGMG